MPNFTRGFCWIKLICFGRYHRCSSSSALASQHGDKLFLYMFSLNYRGSWNQPPAQKETVKLLPQNMIHYFTPFWPNRRSNQSCGTTLGPGVTTLVAPWCCSNLPPPSSATLILKIHHYRYCWLRFDKFCDWWRWHPSSLKPAIASGTPVLNLGCSCSWWQHVRAHTCHWRPCGGVENYYHRTSAASMA